MCLNTVETKFNEDNDISGTGYKAFDVQPACLSNGEEIAPTWINGPIYGMNYQIGQLNTVKRSMCLHSHDNGHTYKSGFHIFTKLVDAQKLAKYWGCKVFKVNYKNITAFGQNEVNGCLGQGVEYGQCVVAKEMTILEQVEEVQNEQTTKSPL